MCRRSFGLRCSTGTSQRAGSYAVHRMRRIATVRRVSNGPLCNSGAHERLRHRLGARRLPARLPRHLRDARHRAGRPRGQGAGRPRPPADPRRAVHQGVALRRAHLPPRARAAPAEAHRPQGQRAVRARELGRSAGDIAARLRDDRRARPAGHRAVQLRRHDGPGAGRGMAARFFHKLGASLLDRTICSSAGGEALAATYGGKVGMHLEHFAESKLIVIWGSNSITSNLHFWTFAQAGQAQRRQADLHRPAQDRNGRQVPPAHRAAARHRRRAGARR